MSCGVSDITLSIVLLLSRSHREVRGEERMITDLNDVFELSESYW